MEAKVPREGEVMAVDWWIALQLPLSLWVAGKVDGKAQRIRRADMAPSPIL